MKATIPRYLFWTKQADALFASRLTEPRAWAGHALILRVSANGLEELWQRDYERLSSGGRTLSDCPYCLVGSTVLMLHGMALECLAKGVIVGLHRTTWSNERRLPDEINRHELVVLLEQAGVTLSDEERELADRLTVLVTSLGRYPVPTTSKGMRVGLTARFEDLEVIAALYSRIEALLPQSEDTPAT